MGEGEFVLHNLLRCVVDVDDKEKMQEAARVLERVTKVPKKRKQLN